MATTVLAAPGHQRQAAAPPWQPASLLAKDGDLAPVVGEWGVAWGPKRGTCFSLGRRDPSVRSWHVGVVVCHRHGVGNIADGRARRGQLCECDMGSRAGF